MVNSIICNNLRQNAYSLKTNNSQVFFTGRSETVPKKKSNKGLVLSLGAAGAGIGVAVLLLKGRLKSAKQLVENIKFQEAKTLEDAINFAQTNLGVQLKHMPNVKVANFINENLVKLSNKGNGKVPLPKTIKIGKLWSGIAGRYNPLNDSVTLSSKNWGELFAKDFDLIKNNPNLKFMLDLKIINLYHEIGHGVQIKKTGLIHGLYPSKKFRCQVSEIKEDLLKYLGDGYDTSSIEYLHFIDNPTETFAQIFAKMMTGNPPPKKIADLYESLGGTLIL